MSPDGGEILKIIGKVRCNVLISGGTGSGKTTLLNCMTNYIDSDERVITCETRPSCSSSRRTWFASKPGRPTSKAPAR